MSSLSRCNECQKYKLVADNVPSLVRSGDEVSLMSPASPSPVSFVSTREAEYSERLRENGYLCECEPKNESHPANAVSGRSHAGLDEDRRGDVARRADENERSYGNGQQQPWMFGEGYYDYCKRMDTEFRVH